MFDLYKGATRPAMMFGVPTDALLWAFVGMGILSISTSIFLWVLFPLIVFLMRMVSKKDDKAFRQWGLYFDTKARNNKTLKRFWGGTSYTPLKKQKYQSWTNKEIKK